MASSTAQPMPETIEAYKALAQRDHDLIAEMKAAHQAEVSKLKARINKLEQSWACKDVARYNQLFEGGLFYAPDSIMERSKKFVDNHIDKRIKGNE